MDSAGIVPPLFGAEEPAVIGLLELLLEKLLLLILLKVVELVPECLRVQLRGI